MKDNKYLKIIINCIVFALLIHIFNNICNIYGVTTVHRLICIWAISFSHIFVTPLLFMFDNIKKIK